MPVDRFAESITRSDPARPVLLPQARITLPEEDILLEIEKQTILRPSST